VYEHRFVHPIAQRTDRRAAGQVLIGGGGCACEQMIDGGDERGEFGLIGLQIYARLQRAADGGALDLARDFFESSQLPSLQKVQNQE